MNVASTFAAARQTLLGLANIAEKPVPVAADLFQWAWTTRTYPHIESAMRHLHVRFEQTTPLPELKKIIGRWIDHEAKLISHKKKQLRPYDLNGLIAFQQMHETIEQFERTV